MICFETVSNQFKSNLST